jgi:hypothetical protein
MSVYEPNGTPGTGTASGSNGSLPSRSWRVDRLSGMSGLGWICFQVAFAHCGP